MLADMYKSHIGAFENVKVVETGGQTEIAQTLVA